MDWNTLIFGGIAILSLAIFFYLAKFKASKSQTERDDKIDWSQRMSFRGCLIVALCLFLVFYLLSSFLS